MSRERDLLFGILAMRLGKVIPDQLEGDPDSLADSLEDLGTSLVRSGVLTEKDREAVASMVEDAIEAHEGDAAAALASLGGEAVLVRTVSGDVPSFEELATIASNPGGSAETIISSGGGPAFDSGEGVVPAVPEHPGRYDEIRAFASGGMGKIWLMHDTHIGRDVALKTLLPERIGHATRSGAPTAELLTVPIIARFLQEARVTGQLEHPSIVPVYELGYRADGSLYYTMKLVRGKSMQEALDEAKDIGERLKLLTHFLDLCYALAYAHSRNVIHRDLKPLNIMLGEFGETVVIDWGIAKVRGLQDIHAKGLSETVRTMRVGDAEATSKTEYGQTIGSPYYMPPEQAEGDPEKVDERSDVYALGAVLYAILAGQPPYKGMKVREFLEKVGDFDPKPIREVEPNAPAELCAVVERAMARKPDDRYPDARALVDEVQKFLSGGLVSAYEYNFAELARRFVKKHKRVLTTAAIATVVLIATGIYSYFSIRAQRDIAVAAKEAEAEAREDAEDARDEAVEARTEAEIARDEALQQLYYANVSQAQSSINERLYGAARETLAASPEANRDWEWRHLLHLVSADMGTLEAGGSRFAYAGGDALVTCTKGGTVRVVDRESGELRHTLVEKGGTGFAFATTVDGARAAVASESGIQVWDTASGETLFSFDDAVRASTRRFLDLSADGSRVGALCSDRKARIWDVATGAVSFELSVDQAQGFGIYFNATGGKVIITRSVFGAEGFERSFELFDAATGTSLGSETLADPNSAHSVAWSPDGNHFAVGTDNNLQLWSVNPFARQHSFDLRFAYPGTIAFSPDGNYLAAGSTDGDAGLWRVDNGKGKIAAKAHPDQIRAITFSPDSSLLVTGSDDATAALWSVPELAPLHTYRGHTSAVFALAFSDDGTELASGAFDGELKRWDMRNELDYRAAGDKLAYNVETGLLAGVVGDSVAVWDVNTGHRQRTLSLESKQVVALALGNEHHPTATVKLAGNEHVVEQWDADAKRISSFQSEPNIQDIIFAGDDSILLKRGTRLELRSTVSGEEQRSWDDIDGFALAGSGTHIAVSQADPAADNTHIVHVFATDTESPVATKTVDSKVQLAMTFADGDATLVLGGQPVDADTGFAMRWNWSDSAEAEQVPLPGRFHAHAAHAASDTHAFGGGNDIVLQRGGNESSTLKGHDGRVVSLTFSPEGTRLVSASHDGTFKIWDTANGREILTLHAAANTTAGQVIQPEFAAFGPDGDWLLTLTNEGIPPLVLRALSQEH